MSSQLRSLIKLRNLDAFKKQFSNEYQGNCFECENDPADRVCACSGCEKRFQTQYFSIPLLVQACLEHQTLEVYDFVFKTFQSNFEFQSRLISEVVLALDINTPIAVIKAFSSVSPEKLFIQIVRKWIRKLGFEKAHKFFTQEFKLDQVILKHHYILAYINCCSSAFQIWDLKENDRYRISVPFYERLLELGLTAEEQRAFETMVCTSPFCFPLQIYSAQKDLEMRLEIISKYPDGNWDIEGLMALAKNKL